MSDQVRAREMPGFDGKTLRQTMQRDGQPIIGLLRQLVLRKRDDQMMQGVRVDKQKQQATDKFQHAVDALDDDCRLKEAVQASVSWPVAHGRDPK